MSVTDFRSNTFSNHFRGELPAGFRRNLGKNMAENADQYLVNKCFNRCAFSRNRKCLFFKQITADQYFSGSADVPNASPWRQVLQGTGFPDCTRRLLLSSSASRVCYIMLYINPEFFGFSCHPCPLQSSLVAVDPLQIPWHTTLIMFQAAGHCSSS